MRQIQAEVEPESKEPWTVNFYPGFGDAGIIEALSGGGSAEVQKQVEKMQISAYTIGKRRHTESLCLAGGAPHLVERAPRQGRIAS